MSGNNAVMPDMVSRELAVARAKASDMKRAFVRVSRDPFRQCFPPRDNGGL